MKKNFLFTLLIMTAYAIGQPTSDRLIDWSSSGLIDPRPEGSDHTIDIIDYIIVNGLDIDWDTALENACIDVTFPRKIGTFEMLVKRSKFKLDGGRDEESFYT